MTSPMATAASALRTGNMVFDMIIAMTVPYIFKLLMGTPLTPS
jgi:hypothetical protein